MRTCFRRRTYSSSAAVTASFLVLCFPARRASSINESSKARLVAMCKVSHIEMCKAIMTIGGSRCHHERGCPILRALCEGACPERSRRVGFHCPILLRIWKAPRPGRARLQSCRKPKEMDQSRKAAKECSPRRKPWEKKEER